MSLLTAQPPELHHGKGLPPGKSGKRRPWQTYSARYLATQISSFTRYFDRVIQWLPQPYDRGDLLNWINCPAKTSVAEGVPFPDLSSESENRTAIVIDGTLNHHFDIQGVLDNLKPKLSRNSRLVVIFYNPYLRWLYVLANRLGIRNGEVPGTFVTRVDLHNLARLCQFEIVKEEPQLFIPFRLLGLGNLLNSLIALVPVVRWFSFVYLTVWRPLIPSTNLGLSCVIPARNESGNIENAILRFPKLECPIEIIFVEGNSTDDTWAEIQRVCHQYRHDFSITALQQTGKGKGDAVRLGFSYASQPLLTILDADLTMPPEMLGRFYKAYINGLGDFVNGSRLLYPMEGEAMRPLNRLGNVFFAKILSWILNTRLSDSLCGTKLLAKHDYERAIAWRQDFGDFDPFGDFELLFPASILGLGVVDLPVRYMARTYGSTNIHRFRHGFQLLRMTVIGFLRFKIAHGSTKS